MAFFAGSSKAPASARLKLRRQHDQQREVCDALPVPHLLQSLLLLGPAAGSAAHDTFALRIRKTTPIFPSRCDYRRKNLVVSFGAGQSTSRWPVPSLFFLPGFNGSGKSVLGRAFSRVTPAGEIEALRKGSSMAGGEHRGGRGGRANVKKTSPTSLRENIRT
uniref:Uncharacterized protein n=1 Tax=Oryza nivara TaxID=4536 RepID=A0A0E0H5M9_ORYNI